MRFSFSSSVGLLALVLVAFGAGCGGGKGVTVSGTVTYNGQPVEKGYVNLFPEDGKSPATGGEVSGGRFTVSNVTAGKNKVVVSSQPSGAAPDSMGDTKKPSTVATTGLVQANDEGNSQVHDIQSGTELKLELRTYSSSAPPAKK
ncbi:hypothetical protein J0H58_11025 [bacterium]|nr:hypothetical protein [bacterium]